VFAVSGCYNKPVRHLASDAALIKIGESNRNDVLTYLGEPDEQVILGKGMEKWVFTEYEDSAFKNAPVVGKYFGEPDYGTVTIILKDNVVVDCVYGAWEFDSQAWTDDFDWQEKRK
jgi:hypothetical protein